MESDLADSLIPLLLATLDNPYINFYKMSNMDEEGRRTKDLEMRFRRWCEQGRVIAETYPQEHGKPTVNTKAARATLRRMARRKDRGTLNEDGERNQFEKFDPHPNDDAYTLELKKLAKDNKKRENFIKSCERLEFARHTYPGRRYITHEEGGPVTVAQEKEDAGAEGKPARVKRPASNDANTADKASSKKARTAKKGTATVVVDKSPEVDESEVDEDDASDEMGSDDNFVNDGSVGMGRDDDFMDDGDVEMETDDNFMDDFNAGMGSDDNFIDDDKEEEKPKPKTTRKPRAKAAPKTKGKGTPTTPMLKKSR